MKIKNSIRLKLRLSFILVTIITGSLAILFGYRLIFNRVITEAQSAVLSHMNMTQYIYNDRINLIRRFMSHLASLDYIRDAILTGDRATLERKLIETRLELDLDILNIADKNGNILMRGRNPESWGDSVIGDLFVQSILQNQEPLWGSDLVDRTSLLTEGFDLAEKARIKMIETPRSRPKTRDFEDRGLVMKAGAPIFHGDELIGVIYGAKLVNNNFDLVDQIQSLVFQGEKLGERDLGNATVFLSDVRVSTNVRTEDGSRAIGTLVSEEVFRRVVEGGETWLDEAFVVDSWYISAYNPIQDTRGEVIGILYVGVLRDKYDEIKWQTAINFLLIIIISGAISLLLSIYFLRKVYRPYLALLESTRGLTEGTFKKIKVESEDEVGTLAKTFNAMIDAIRDRDEKLRIQTEKQIGQSEKLASLGRLASGIAHEINNPLTGILTFSNLLKEDLKDTEYEEDLDTIIEETMRCRKIVRGVLDFARETRLEREQTNINQILRDVLSLLERHVQFQNIQINADLSEEIPNQEIDINLMKSVVNNLAVNASDAMPLGGTLNISTRFIPEKDAVEIVFQDSGIGISEENLEKIFDPFFTTKAPGEGTGLGMAVTYGIIQRHNGTIQIESAVGKGTKVVIHLPVKTNQDSENNSKNSQN